MCCDFPSRAPPHPCTAVFQSNQNGSLCQSTNLHEQTVLQNPRLHQNSCQGYNNYANDCTRQHRCYSLKMLCALIIPTSSPAPRPLTHVGSLSRCLSQNIFYSHPSRMFQKSRRYQNSQALKSLIQHKHVELAYATFPWLLFFFLFSFCDRVSLCSPGQPW